MNALNEQSIREIIQGGESESVGFEAALREPASLAKELAAFANMAGGVILVGVQETGLVAGADEQQVRKLVESSQGFLSSKVDVQVQQALVQGKPVVALLVSPSEELIFSNGQALGRSLSDIQPLSAAQLSSKLAGTHSKTSIENLAEAIARQTLIIEVLRDELREANSFKSKLKDYVIGGVVGAVIGILFSPWVWTR